MNTRLDPSKPDEVKLGQIRRFTTAGRMCYGLVFRTWEPGNSWLVCPVKDLVGDDEEPTGVAVYAQPTLEWGLLGAGGLYALPQLGGTINAERVAAAPLVWEVIPQTVEQVWRLFRAPIADEWPDPEKDFHFFRNSNSPEDWEKSYIVLGPIEDDEGDDGDDDDDGDNGDGEPEPDPPRRPRYDSRDIWGPCCSGCTWAGQAHKPCAACAE